MLDPFIQYFSKIAPLSKEERAFIEQDTLISGFDKGHILLKEGQTASDNYFVLEGCIKQYVLKNGNEHITKFYTEGEWILPAAGGVKSSYYIECLEPCQLVIANDQEGNEIMKSNPKFAEIAIKILENEISAQQREFTLYQNSSPEERYLRLLDTRPELAQRVPQFQLASYIGVKPESLSRIRMRLADKKRKDHAS